MAKWLSKKDSPPPPPSPREVQAIRATTQQLLAEAERAADARKRAFRPDACAAAERRYQAAIAALDANQSQVERVAGADAQGRF